MRRSGIRLVFVLLLSLLSACGAPSGSGSASSNAAPTTAASAAGPASVAPSVEAQTSAVAAPETAPPSAAATSTAAGTELSVFAAASLTDAFGEIGQKFDAANGSTTTFNFAGSNQLAQQITQGAPADVFASANNTQMNNVIEAGDIISGTQRTFVRNRLVLIHPSDNPAGLSSLEDVAKPGVKLVLAAKEVPVGQYALDFLAQASELPQYTAAYSETVLANVVSYEENVRSVLSKVALGEADAGIVYTSDVAADTTIVGQIPIPDELNTIASYPIAATANAAEPEGPSALPSRPELAQRFVDYVLSAEGQQILVSYGFISTTGDAGGGTPGAVPVEVTGLVDNPGSLGADELGQLEQKEIK